MVLLIFIFFFNEVETQEQKTEVKTYTNLIEAFQNPSDCSCPEFEQPKPPKSSETNWKSTKFNDAFFELQLAYNTSK